MKWKNIGQCTTMFLITATITEWQPLLARDYARKVLLDDLNFYRRKYDCRILAYVIMPEHYHVVLQLNQPDELHRWLRDVQSHTATELSKWLRLSLDQEELGIYSRHANGHSDLAIWKEQARAVSIVSEGVLRQKIEYVHANPVRRGLVCEPGEWPWSSWRNYHADDDSVFRIDRAEII
jgi:REP element-mobilizing transposase RayT